MDSEKTGGKPFPIDRVCAEISGEDKVRRSIHNWYIGQGRDDIFPGVKTSYKPTQEKDKDFLMIRCWRDTFADGKWGGRLIYETKIKISSPLKQKPIWYKTDSNDSVKIKRATF